MSQTHEPPDSNRALIKLAGGLVAAVIAVCTAVYFLQPPPLLVAYSLTDKKIYGVQPVRHASVFASRWNGPLPEGALLGCAPPNIAITVADGTDLGRSGFQCKFHTNQSLLQAVLDDLGDQFSLDTECDIDAHMEGSIAKEIGNAATLEFSSHGFNEPQMIHDETLAEIFASTRSRLQDRGFEVEPFERVTQ